MMESSATVSDFERAKFSIVKEAQGGQLYGKKSIKSKYCQRRADSYMIGRVHLVSSEFHGVSIIAGRPSQGRSARNDIAARSISDGAVSLYVVDPPGPKATPLPTLESSQSSRQ